MVGVDIVPEAFSNISSNTFWSSILFSSKVTLFSLRNSLALLQAAQPGAE
jgi:hypothetical protein